MVDEKQDTDSRDPGPETPAPSDANGAVTERLRAVAVCSFCGAGPHATLPGRCAKGHPIVGNQLARKHIANVARREQLYAENVAEYKPDTLQLRDACRWLANVRERLDTIREGTAEHDRLLANWTKLTATLEASRQARESHRMTNLEQLSPDEIVAKAERMLEMARLIRDSGREPLASTATHSVPEPSELGYVEPEGTEPAPPPLETCPFCRRPLAECADLRATRPDVLEALHYDSPEMVEQRRQKATAEMFESLRRARMGGDPNVR
jgi:hypothetical protein